MGTTTSITTTGTATSTYTTTGTATSTTVTTTTATSTTVTTTERPCACFELCCELIPVQNGYLPVQPNECPWWWQGQITGDWWKTGTKPTHPFGTFQPNDIPGHSEMIAVRKLTLGASGNGSITPSALPVESAAPGPMEPPS